jgi:hypothetical protein
MMTAHEKIAVQHKNVYVALAQAQAEMGPLVKGSVNPAFKSKYADLADLTAAVREPLTRNGLSFYHSMVLGDRDLMRTSLVHGESDTRIDCDVPLIVDRNNMQGMKSATTYAKRIGLESVTGIAPEDDDGNAAAKSPPIVDERPVQRGPSAMDVACESLTNADSLDQLSAIWRDLPRSVQGEAKVIKAKDARKAALTPAMDESEIPY